MSGKQQRFKYIMIVIAIVGILGTVIPSLLETDYAAAEKAVICISYLLGVPLVVFVVYKIGSRLMKG